MRIRRAIVLAAGEGSRLAPLTRVVPKPLLPVLGTPLLLRNLQMLRSWGVEDVLINLHHGAAAIINASTGWKTGLRLTFSFEPDLLDTGGALARAHWFADGAPFWLMNADVACEGVEPAMLFAVFRKPCLAAVWVVPNTGPRTVNASHGRVLTFRAPSRGHAGASTFSGLHLVAPRILKFIPAEGRSSIITAYESAIASGETVRAVEMPRALWADIGTFEGYLAANDLLKHGQPWSCVAPDARMGRGCSIRNSVVMHGARIASRSRLQHAVIAPHAPAAGRVSGLVMRASDMPEPIPCAVSLLGWKTDRASAAPLPGRASDRSFVRIRAGSESAMLIIRGTDRPENEFHVRHTRFLSRLGIRVPALMGDFPRLRITAMEDVGDYSLQSLLPGMSRKARMSAYRRILEIAARLHSPETARKAARHTMAEPFGPPLYGWEHDLFVTHFLVPFVHPSGSTVSALRRELAGVANTLAGEALALVHRDFQSSNLIRHRGEWVVIDYQGMRLGPAVYDIASLLFDPYATLPKDEQIELFSCYTDAAGRRASDLSGPFRAACIQRLIQALGAYGRMQSLRQTARFRVYIAPGLRMLIRALDGAEGTPVLRHVAEEALRKEMQR